MHQYCIKLFLNTTIIKVSFHSQTLTATGVISGGDMTPEAALAKLSYILNKSHISWEQKKKVNISLLISIMVDF